MNLENSYVMVIGTNVLDLRWHPHEDGFWPPVYILKLLCASECQDTQRTGPSGQIYFSPNNRENIAGGCTYHITVEDGHYVILMIDYIQIYNSEDCQQFVKIYDGDAPTEDNLMQTWVKTGNTHIDTEGIKLCFHIYSDATAAGAAAAAATRRLAAGEF